MPSLYTLTDPSPEWPVEFERERERLLMLLGDVLVKVHHIGSTSVPDLAAKPTIDLLPEVRAITAVDEFESILVDAGYRAWGEYGLPGRRLYTKDTDRTRTHNVHFYEQGHPDVERHCAFCAYLRNHRSERNTYAALKQEAYRRHPADIVAYNDYKCDWICRVEKIAIEWYRRQSSESA